MCYRFLRSKDYFTFSASEVLVSGLSTVAFAERRFLVVIAELRPLREQISTSSARPDKQRQSLRLRDCMVSAGGNDFEAVHRCVGQFRRNFAQVSQQKTPVSTAGEA